MSSELLKSAERFLFHEARLMDEHRLSEWLALWDTDALYWVPCGNEEPGPRRLAAIIYDDRAQLEQRIARLQGRQAYSQQPQSALIRVLSNVEIESTKEDTVVLTSTFSLGEWRNGRQTAYFGRNFHTLAIQENSFRIRTKKVLLLNNDGPLGNLTFLL